MGMQYGHGHAPMDMGMALFNISSIVALLMHFVAPFLLLLHSFPSKDHRRWPLWTSSHPSSQAMTVSNFFLLQRQCMWNFHIAMTIFKNVIVFFPKGSVYHPHPLVHHLLLLLDVLAKKKQSSYQIVCSINSLHLVWAISLHFTQRTLQTCCCFSWMVMEDFACKNDMPDFSLSYLYGCCGL